MIKVIKSNKFYVKVDTKKEEFNLPSSTFKTYYIKDSDNTVLPVSSSFSEVVLTVSAPRVSTTTSPALVGDKSIDVSGSLIDGDTFKDPNGNMYYILTRTASNITLKKSLVQDIVAGSTLTQVGNTGIYKLEMRVDDVGSYTIIIENPTVNMSSRSLSIMVEEDSKKFKGFV